MNVSYSAIPSDRQGAAGPVAATSDPERASKIRRFVIMGHWPACVMKIVGGQRVRKWWPQGRGAIGLMVILLVAMTVTTTVAQPVSRGTWEATVAGGFSFSHNELSGEPGLSSVQAYQFLPHVGYVVTDERGSGWLRGNFEVMLEPTVIHFDTAQSPTVAGAAVLGRWLFTGRGIVRPYLEAGGGAVVGRSKLPQTDCDVNFLVEGGPGVMIFASEQVAFTAGYRLHHMSNGSVCSPNVGLNSSLFLLGVSYFFR